LRPALRTVVKSPHLAVVVSLPFWEPDDVIPKDTGGSVGVVVLASPGKHDTDITSRVNGEGRIGKGVIRIPDL
jgi:hypothetical protein